MASVTIQEFLVSLGFKTDETSLRKFREGVSGVTKSVVRLGSVIEGLALTVSVAVERWSASLESLYFASRRTGESADQLTAYGRALQNFGVGADEAMGAVEGLASFLRNNPGGQNILAGWLGSVGLSAEDANGKLLDQAGLMKQIGKMFQIMRQEGRTFLANQLAGMMGISEKSMLAMSTPGFEDEEARQEKRTKGFTKAAEAAHKFMMEWRDLKQQMQQTLLPFEEAALRALERLMPKLSKLMHDHGKQIVADLSGLFTFFIEGIGKLFDFLDKRGREMLVRLEALFLDLNLNFTLYVQPIFGWLVDAFLKLDELTGGWSSKLLTVYGLLKLLGAGGLISGIASLGAGLAKALGGLGAAALGADTWAAAGSAFGAAAAVGIAGAIGVALGYLIDKLAPKKAVDFVGEKGADLIETILKAVHFANEAAAHDPGTYGGSNPWRNSAGGPPPITVHIENNVSGFADSHKAAAHIADATEAAARRAAADLIREFSSVLQ